MFLTVRIFSVQEQVKYSNRKHYSVNIRGQRHFGICINEFLLTQSLILYRNYFIAIINISALS